MKKGVPIYYTPERIEEMRRVAAECEYDLRAIARRMCVCIGTVRQWSCAGRITPPGKSLYDMQRVARVQRIQRALELCGGNIDKAAASLGYSRATLYGAFYKLGLRLRDFAARPGRACVICGQLYSNAYRRVVTCSPACRHAKLLQKQAQRRERLRDFEPKRRETELARTRSAILEARGRTDEAARIAGVCTSALQYRIREWNLRYVVDMARAVYDDADRLFDLMKECDYDAGRLCRELGRGRKWLNDKVAELGAPHILAEAPCLECGRMCPRPNGKRGMCSIDCRRARDRRLKRERYYADAQHRAKVLARTRRRYEASTQCVATKAA